MPNRSSAYLNFNPLRFSLPPKSPSPSNEERRNLIAKAAYFRAEQRRFEPGHEVEDWLAAESEVDRRMSKSAVMPRRAP